ncbi:hypothetical protein [Paenirhodobacter sp.]|uniref:hypothetical protein n=1 Tax=Paenirhodobacter sp. TaxID=1965326 RepID=UPI003B50CF08
MQTELLVIGAVLAAAFLRGLTGFGFALAAVPPVEAVTIAVLLQLAVGLRDVMALRGSYDRGAVLRLGAGALLGTPFGVALMAAPGLAVSGGIGWHGLLLAASALPALMLGSWAGAQLFRRMRSGQYRAMALAVLAVFAVLTGLRGLVG